MVPFRKFSAKVFSKNETPKKPKLRDKILPNSQSTPLLPHGPEAYARHKPVYKGRTPLKKEIIKVRLEGPDFEKAASLYSRESCDVDEVVTFSTTPRDVPSLEAKPKVLPPEESAADRPTFKGLLPKPSAPPKHRNKEIVKPVTIISRHEEESDDSDSLYSVSGTTVYNENMFDEDEMPPSFPHKFIPYVKPSNEYNIKQFPSPYYTSKRFPRLCDVIKPVNQLDLPPEIQKDLLPPSPVTFPDRLQAAKERENQNQKFRIERERIFREREAELLGSRPFPASPLAMFGRSLATGPNMQSPPAGVEQPTATRARGEVRPYLRPQSKLNRNISDPIPTFRAAEPHHAPSASAGVPNLKPCSGARHKDLPQATGRSTFKQGLPASPRAADARQVHPTYVTTGYAGSPIRPLAIRKVAKNLSNKAVVDSDTSDGPSYTYSTGHFRMHSDIGEFGRLPPYLKKQYTSYDGRV